MVPDENRSSHEDPVFAKVYDALRGLAAQRVRVGLGGASLQAPALVHEVWLKLAASDELTPRDASRYYATAAQAMRWILVDRARRRTLRGAEEGRPVEEISADSGPRDLETLQLDEALERLARTHPRKAEVVMHRHFAGLSVEETAEALGLSTATVKREWRFARAWLLRAMAEDSGES